MRRLLPVILLILAACQPMIVYPPTPVVMIVTATPETIISPVPVFPTNTLAVTPTQAIQATGIAYTPQPVPPTIIDELPGAGFAILNDNPMLRFPSEGQTRARITDGYTSQWYPASYELYNDRRTGSGESGGTTHTGFAPIAYDGNGYVFDVGVIAGEWGYSQVVTLTEPGCYLLKATGEYAILDDQFATLHPYNYGMRAIVQRGVTPLRLPRWTFTEVSESYEAFWTVYAGTPGDLLVTMAVSITYATAAPGSWVRLDTWAVAHDLDGDHCNNNTPGI